jgi:hypothetical protein
MGAFPAGAAGFFFTFFFAAIFCCYGQWFRGANLGNGPAGLAHRMPTHQQLHQRSCPQHNFRT